MHTNDARRSMTTACSIHSWVWISAFLLSLAIAGAVVVAFLQVGPTPKTTFAIPPLASAIAAFIYTVTWPRGSWRWGVVLSSGFWLFFFIVFVSYASIGKFDYLSLLRAVSVVLAGLFGAGIATRLRQVVLTAEPGSS